MKKKDSHKQKSQIPLVFDKFYFKNHCFATVRGMPFIYLGIQHITQCQQGLLPVLSEKKKKTVQWTWSSLTWESKAHRIISISFRGGRQVGTFHDLIISFFWFFLPCTKSSCCITVMQMCNSVSSLNPDINNKISSEKCFLKMCGKMEWNDSNTVK